VPIAFSALDAAIALEVEPAFARAGTLVVSNASAFRMEPDVPLLIPEVNGSHLGLLAQQRITRGWSGGIIANPNCSTAALVLALAPLHQAFGLRLVVAATLQAASGAGYPGVPSLDLLGNVIPFIGGEEEKIERETRKILGAFAGNAVREAAVTVSAMVHRVPVVDGHLVSVSLAFDRAPTPEEAIAVLEQFRGDPAVTALPSSPTPVIEVDRRPDRPQSRLDVDRGSGMAVTIGRVRTCPLHHLRLVALSHNLVRVRRVRRYRMPSGPSPRAKYPADGGRSGGQRHGGHLGRTEDAVSGRRSLRHRAVRRPRRATHRPRGRRGPTPATPIDTVSRAVPPRGSRMSVRPMRTLTSSSLSIALASSVAGRMISSSSPP